MTRKPDASKRSRSYVETLTSSPPAEDAAWTEAPGCRRLQLTSESAGKEYSRAPATEWLPPKTSITESAPIPAKAKPVEAFPSASDRKSTRLNSSHRTISYAVFCLKKKNEKPNQR